MNAWGLLKRGKLSRESKRLRAVESLLLSPHLRSCIRNAVLRGEDCLFGSYQEGGTIPKLGAHVTSCFQGEEPWIANHVVQLAFSLVQEKSRKDGLGTSCGQGDYVEKFHSWFLQREIEVHVDALRHLSLKTSRRKGKEETKESVAAKRRRVRKNWQSFLISLSPFERSDALRGVIEKLYSPETKKGDFSNILLILDPHASKWECSKLGGQLYKLRHNVVHHQDRLKQYFLDYYESLSQGLEKASLLDTQTSEVDFLLSRTEIFQILYGEEGVDELCSSFLPSCDETRYWVQQAVGKPTFSQGVELFSAHLQGAPPYPCTSDLAQELQLRLFLEGLTIFFQKNGGQKEEGCSPFQLFSDWMELSVEDEERRNYVKSFCIRAYYALASAQIGDPSGRNRYFAGQIFLFLERWGMTQKENILQEIGNALKKVCKSSSRPSVGKSVDREVFLRCSSLIELCISSFTREGHKGRVPGKTVHLDDAQDWDIRGFEARDDFSFLDLLYGKNDGRESVANRNKGFAEQASCSIAPSLELMKMCMRGPHSSEEFISLWKRIELNRQEAEWHNWGSLLVEESFLLMSRLHSKVKSLWEEMFNLYETAICSSGRELKQEREGGSAPPLEILMDMLRVLARLRTHLEHYYLLLMEERYLHDRIQRGRRSQTA